MQPFESVFEWSTPPEKKQFIPPKRESVIFPSTAEDRLRDRPGEWALVCKRPTVINAHYLIKKLPDFEFATRKVDGEYRLWVRYIGKAESAAA